MADDNNVEITFGASTDEFTAGCEQVSDGLASLKASVNGLGGTLDRLGDAFGAALPLDKLAQSVVALTNMGEVADQSAAQIKQIGVELKLLQQGLAQKKIVLDAEVSQFQITQDQKFALLEAETEKEYQAQLALLEQEMGISNATVAQRQQALDRIEELEAKHRTDMLRLDEQSIAAQQALWTGYLVEPDDSL